MKQIALTLALVVSLPLAACRVSVDETPDHTNADVRILTPVGSVLVRTGYEQSETGLKVYPGARALRDRHEPQTADVSVGNSVFGVKVATAKYESDAPPESIVDFYKKQMGALGAVTECRGNVNFRGDRPVCRGAFFARTTQLAVGTEEQHRLVSVKKRGNGSEFSVVYVRTRGV